MHLFIARTQKEVTRWCEEREVNPLSVRYLETTKENKRYTYYNLVFLDRWYNARYGDRHLIDLLVRKAINIIYAGESEPVVYAGRIIDWKRVEKPAPT